MQEIERKFLVDITKLPGCLKPMKIAQGYLNTDPDRTVRIRIADTKGFITIKGKSSENGLSRYEWEREISLVSAMKLFELCTQKVEKIRYHMIHQQKLWEIDVFQGLNKGLVVAEIELQSEDESFEAPEWVTEEVTGNPKYYNSNLGTNPYQWWVHRPKITDPRKWLANVEESKKFQNWCKEKGYFPHTKYFEAWKAALESQ